MVQFILLSRKVNFIPGLHVKNILHFVKINFIKKGGQWVCSSAVQ